MTDIFFLPFRLKIWIPFPRKPLHADFHVCNMIFFQKRSAILFFAILTTNLNSLTPKTYRYQVLRKLSLCSNFGQLFRRFRPLCPCQFNHHRFITLGQSQYRKHVPEHVLQYFRLIFGHLYPKIPTFNDFKFGKKMTLCKYLSVKILKFIKSIINI